MTKILHIEDDPANRLLVRKLLRPSGFDVIEATDGLTGIRMARAENPDLILVDIAIPGLDGYEVTLRLRAEPKLQRTPIVAITAEGNRETSLAVGCDGFLQKPIDARSFAATIKSYLSGRREQTTTELTGEHLRLQSQRIASHLEEKLAELKAANDRLIDLDAARKEFYRNISHELATPMTPIVGYVKLLADRELGPLTVQQDKALRSIDECVQRLRALIDNLIDVTGIETGRMRFALRDYDLLDVVRRTLARHRPVFEERRIRLLVDLPRNPLKGMGDPDRIARAVSQLLDNAAKFTPEGGAVGVRVSQVSRGEFVVSIADTGPGVPPAALERIFEPFFQADGSPTRSFGGTGVGLAIARGVAIGHGGDLRAESPAREDVEGVPLRGAAFYLTLADRPPSGGGNRVA